MSNGIAAERRKQPRKFITAKVRLEWTASTSHSHWVLAQALNLSEGGMRVEINEPLPPIERVRFEVVKLNLRGAATVRNRAIRGRRSQLGLEFAGSTGWTDK